MSLQSLPSLLRDEPALAAVLGRRSAVLAVPEAARPLALAGLARISGRSPLLVAVPTGTAAQRLADDLQQLLPPDDVELFPAWETLPFERVSPSVETMGRRLRVLWRLQDDAAGRPRLASSWPASGPCSNGSARAPITSSLRSSAPARRSTPRCCWPSWSRPGTAARSWSSTAVRWHGEAPSSTSSRRRPTRPVRIDLWGDEVDRLTEFSVHDQRSTDPVDEAVIMPARELRRRPRSAHVQQRLVAAEPWGREQWERLAEGLTFDGMESWLPWLVDGEDLLTDLLPSDGPGHPRRAQAPPGPGRRRAGRGGRPGQDAGPDLGGRRRRPRSRASTCRPSAC